MRPEPHGARPHSATSARFVYTRDDEVATRAYAGSERPSYYHHNCSMAHNSCGFVIMGRTNARVSGFAFLRIAGVKLRNERAATLKRIGGRKNSRLSRVAHSSSLLLRELTPETQNKQRTSWQLWLPCRLSCFFFVRVSLSLRLLSLMGLPQESASKRGGSSSFGGQGNPCGSQRDPRL